ncbi:MAG: hypothetical protein INR69_15250 [Mucilaginibacter polytrichastri]|nr:hypothetical protein [Mucilaginibacter polytrichastri]
MISVLLLLLFLAFFLWQATADDQKKSPSLLAERIRQNRMTSRAVSGAIILTAFIYLAATFGVTSGLITLILILMTAGSLSVLFYPFPYIKWYLVVCFFLVSLTLEIYL